MNKLIVIIVILSQCFIHVSSSFTEWGSCFGCGSAAVVKITSYGGDGTMYTTSLDNTENCAVGLPVIQSTYDNGTNHCDYSLRDSLFQPPLTIKISSDDSIGLKHIGLLKESLSSVGYDASLKKGNIWLDNAPVIQWSIDYSEILLSFIDVKICTQNVAESGTTGTIKASTSIATGDASCTIAGISMNQCKTCRLQCNNIFGSRDDCLFGVLDKSIIINVSGDDDVGIKSVTVTGSASDQSCYVRTSTNTKIEAAIWMKNGSMRVACGGYSIIGT